jgi:hypothetical protein
MRSADISAETPAALGLPKNVVELLHTPVANKDVRIKSLDERGDLRIRCLAEGAVRLDR